MGDETENDDWLPPRSQGEERLDQARTQAFQETRRWIEETTGKPFSYDNDYRRSLANGILLCEVCNKLKPGTIRKINRLPTPIAGMDNLSVFLRVCEEVFGLSKNVLFQLSDLEDLTQRAIDEQHIKEETDKRLVKVAVTVYYLSKSCDDSPVTPIDVSFLQPFISASQDRVSLVSGSLPRSLSTASLTSSSLNSSLSKPTFSSTAHQQEHFIVPAAPVPQVSSNPPVTSPVSPTSPTPWNKKTGSLDTRKSSAPLVSSNPLQFVKSNRSVSLAKKASEIIEIVEQNKSKLSQEALRMDEDEWQSSLTNWRAKRRKAQPYNHVLDLVDGKDDESTIAQARSQVRSFRDMVSRNKGISIPDLDSSSVFDDVDDPFGSSAGSKSLPRRSHFLSSTSIDDSAFTSPPPPDSGKSKKPAFGKFSSVTGEEDDNSDLFASLPVKTQSSPKPQSPPKTLDKPVKKEPTQLIENEENLKPEEKIKPPTFAKPLSTVPSAKPPVKLPSEEIHTLSKTVSVTRQDSSLVFSSNERVNGDTTVLTSHKSSTNKNSPSPKTSQSEYSHSLTFNKPSTKEETPSTNNGQSESPQLTPKRKDGVKRVVSIRLNRPPGGETNLFGIEFGGGSGQPISVRRVKIGSPADVCEVRQGDILVSLNDQPIEKHERLASIEDKIKQASGQVNMRFERQKNFSDPEDEFLDELMEEELARSKERPPAHMLSPADETPSKSLDISLRSSHLNDVMDGNSRHQEAGRLSLVQSRNQFFELNDSQEETELAKQATQSTRLSNLISSDQTVPWQQPFHGQFRPLASRLSQQTHQQPSRISLPPSSLPFSSHEELESVATKKPAESASNHVSTTALVLSLPDRESPPDQVTESLHLSPTSLNNGSRTYRPTSLIEVTSPQDEPQETSPDFILESNNSNRQFVSSPIHIETENVPNKKVSVSSSSPEPPKRKVTKSGIQIVHEPQEDGDTTTDEDSDNEHNAAFTPRSNISQDRTPRSTDRQQSKPSKSSDKKSGYLPPSQVAPNHVVHGPTIRQPTLEDQVRALEEVEKRSSSSLKRLQLAQNTGTPLDTRSRHSDHIQERPLSQERTSKKTVAPPIPPKAATRRNDIAPQPVSSEQSLNPVVASVSSPPPPSVPSLPERSAHERLYPSSARSTSSGPLINPSTKSLAPIPPPLMPRQPSLTLDDAQTPPPIPPKQRPISSSGGLSSHDRRSQNGRHSLPPREQSSNSSSKSSTSAMGAQDDKKVPVVSSKKKCSFCFKRLGSGDLMVIESMQLHYHLECFKCSICGCSLGTGKSDADVRVRLSRLHCARCYSMPTQGTTPPPDMPHYSSSYSHSTTSQSSRHSYPTGSSNGHTQQGSGTTGGITKHFLGAF